MRKKKVFITGGSRGIGAAMVRAFSPTHQVTFTYRTEEAKAFDLIKELGSPPGLGAVQMDLLDPEGMKAILAHLEGEGYDIVIHNAAATSDQVFYFMEEDQWQNIIQASLNSFFYINKAFLPNMIANRWGRIITMASVSGESGQRGQSNYAAAKGALIAASKSLAKEVARKGVLVNVISPGLIETDMSGTAPVADILPLIPIGRIGQADEVAKAALFLASDDASYICGSILQVNGGLYT